MKLKATPAPQPLFSQKMSESSWDFTLDADMNRNSAEQVIRERENSRDRKRESSATKVRPTFLVRRGSKGEPVLSFWDDVNSQVLHASIQVESDSFALRNTFGDLKSGSSLRNLLLELDYIDKEKEQKRADTEVVVVTPAISSTVKWTIRESDIKILQLLGEGQSGKVFKARHNGSDVAVKQLKLSYRSKELEATAMADLAAELTIMQALPWHENVVACRGAVVSATTGAPAAIVSEFCSGGSLLTAIHSKAWEKWKSTKIRLTLGIARGIEHLHTYGIVHRDVAARNVLLAPAAGGELLPKVTDFGMSRAVDDVDETQTTVSNVGPVRWMAPEQLQELSYSSRSDVYSFGCVVFELFMRKRPWEEHVTLIETIDAVNAGKRPVFASKCKIPRALQELVTRCWAHVPTERPSMTMIREELESLVDRNA